MAYGREAAVACLIGRANFVATTTTPAQRTSASSHPAKPIRLIVPFAADGGTEPVGSTPEEFAAHLQSEVAKWRKVIVEADIKPE